MILRDINPLEPFCAQARNFPFFGPKTLALAASGC